jgi:translation initiation factor eIF-2B subunit delta
MTTDGAQPVPAGDGIAKKEQKPQSQAKKPQQKDQAAPSDSTGEKKLSNAELKKKAKEEKAARRAQAKVALVSASTVPLAAPGGAGDAKSGKGKANNPKQAGLPPPSHHRSASRSVLPPVAKEVAKPKIPECFSHLSMARRVAITQADKDVNPVVLALGQQMSTFAISDSITRLESTLLAFKKVHTGPLTPLLLKHERCLTNL